jgi:Zn-dependent protease
MFGQIPPTPYDLRFHLLGIPVRVHPIFWLTSAYLAWQGGELDVVIIRVLCIFFAILIHEMGHALVTRSFGWQPEIVLYILGGYTTATRHTTWKSIAVSAAGPAAGLMLFSSIWWWGRLTGVLSPDSTLLRPVFSAEGMANWPEFIRVGSRANHLFLDAINFSLFINLIWTLFNLLPVHPLDGGQIVRELCLWFNPRRGMDACLVISIVAAGAVVLWALWARQPFAALMFGALAFQNIQEYQGTRRGYW